MPAVIKACTALLVTLVILTGCAGQTASPGDYIGLPDGNAVIYEKLTRIMGGEVDRLYIYGDGSVIYVEDTNLRMPGPEAPRTRTWKKGNIEPQEFAGLLEYFRNAGLNKLEDYYNFPGEPAPGGYTTAGDMNLNLSVNIEGLYRNIQADAYLTPDNGQTYPGLPFPLNDIYARLMVIAGQTTEFSIEKLP